MAKCFGATQGRPCKSPANIREGGRMYCHHHAKGKKPKVATSVTRREETSHNSNQKNKHRKECKKEWTKNKREHISGCVEISKTTESRGHPLIEWHYPVEIGKKHMLHPKKLVYNNVNFLNWWNSHKVFERDINKHGKIRSNATNQMEGLRTKRNPCETRSGDNYIYFLMDENEYSPLEARIIYHQIYSEIVAEHEEFAIIKDEVKSGKSIVFLGSDCFDRQDFLGAINEEEDQEKCQVQVWNKLLKTPSDFAIYHHYQKYLDGEADFCPAYVIYTMMSQTSNLWPWVNAEIEVEE